MDTAQRVLLPAGPRAPAAARRLVRERLTSWAALEGVVDPAVLLVSELVTNVVVHTTGQASLEVDRAGAQGVRVGVFDASPTLPVRRRHSATATTGRGVVMLEDLSDEWGTTEADGGKAVWFLLSGRRDPWASTSADALSAEEEKA